MINYFELFGIRATLHPDQGAVKAKFYELSRQFHPDRFANAGPEAMAEALKMSAMVNDAYKIFKDEDRLQNYVLKYHGMLEDEEKYNLPPDFLMEMMELNEAVSEAELDAEEDLRRRAIESWQNHMQALDEELRPLMEKYDEGDQSQTLLSEIKDYYFRKKYLLRIKERIAKFAAL